MRLNWLTRRSFINILAANLAACAALAFSAHAEAPQPAQAPAAQTEEKPVVVFAAASLKTALDAIAADWKAHSGKSVSIVYQSSDTLANQIKTGESPADIFISADIKWMDYLEHAKLIQVKSHRNLLGNQLVLIEPADATETIEIKKGFDLAGATGDGKIAVCTIASCPGGIYAKEALESLGVFSKVKGKLAQAQNIRGALSFVARGEAKFGIVYASDAKAEPKVKVIGTFPASSHSPIVYPAALVDSSTNPDAPSFLAYLGSKAAAKIFTEQGFYVLLE
ncbi:MAG TPA: molybdate ABC transporter substrate-binding protein [Methylocella sp.]|nr:molybdate ABC transporter substrate-binding protein [Methylocella sp.]